jgi:hypothetical protein
MDNCLCKGLGNRLKLGFLQPFFRGRLVIDPEEERALFVIGVRTSPD